jgi:hypothetical protein
MKDGVIIFVLCLHFYTIFRAAPIYPKIKAINWSMSLEMLVFHCMKYIPVQYKSKEIAPKYLKNSVCIV